MRLLKEIILLALILLILTGCAEQESPSVPRNSPDQITGNPVHQTQTHLWGYSKIHLDTRTGEVSQLQCRTPQFTANVTNFLNGNPLSLSFSLNEIIATPDFLDVDIDVRITHPFPGMTKYNGYDVRGIFMSNGSGILNYNIDLLYPVNGTDQFMLSDPGDGIGGPDGYTRWFNLTEFSTGGMSLLNYTPGAMATPGYSPSATINPYRYFADSLGAEDDLFTWLTGNPDLNGVFSSGSAITGNYYLRFPVPDPDVVFGYAVIANWEGDQPEDHPSNTPEAVGCRVVDSSNVYYVDPSSNGGSLVLDISVFDWGSEISGGVMEDYSIIIESTVLSTPYTLDPSEMTPTGGDSNYSTYSVEIPADNVTGQDGNEYWVIVEYPNEDYKNDFGVTNLAGDDPLAALFRYDLDVTDQPSEIICDLVITDNSPAMPFEGWGVFEFDASDSYDPGGNPLSFEWDFDNDGTFGDSFEGGTDSTPQKLFDFVNQDQVCVKVTNGIGGEAVCCVDVDITGHPMKNIELRPDAEAMDIGIDHTNGNLFVIYSDATVYNYPRSSWYATGNQFVTINTLVPIPYYIDVLPNQYVLTGITYTSNECPGAWLFEPDGTMVNGYGINCGYTYLDVAGMGTTDTFANDTLMIAGYTYLAVDWVGIYNWDFPYDPGHWFHRVGISDFIYTGEDIIYYQYVQGAETDRDGDYIWFLEDPDYYASRWHLYATGFVGYMEYDNAAFGTGSQTDNDNGWNDARDISRDDQNRFFVLDRLSTGEPRVKVWTVSGNSTTSLGGFGDSTSIEGEPSRIEGGDFEGNIVVLHGSTQPQKISVFHPIEMPG